VNKSKPKYIIGIDEVGRGALAGSVTVAAVALLWNFQTKIRVNSRSNPRQFASIKLRDSKKLSPKQREIWFKWIKENSKISYAVANVQPKIIDKINISNAANLAATRAFNRLVKNKNIGASINGSRVFLDGGLYLNKNIRVNPLLKKIYPRLSVSTIIKGDEKIPAISLASIAAKVSRDKLMKKLHKKYPRYDFVNNVGYGTRKHIEAIKKYGRLPIHRKSFKIK